MYVYVQKVYTIVLHFSLSSGLSYKPLAYAIIHISNITYFISMQFGKLQPQEA